MLSSFVKKPSLRCSHWLSKLLLPSAIVALGLLASAESTVAANKKSTIGIPYSSEPLDYEIETLPSHYRGHSISEVQQKIKPPRDKGEYEKTEAYEAKISHWKSLSFLGNVTPADFLAFELSSSTAPATISFGYDADREELKTTVTFDESHALSGPGTWLETNRRTKALGSHIGMTGMGVKFRVNSYFISSTGLAIGGGVLHREFTFTKPLPVEEALQIKPNLAAFAIVSLASPYKVNERTIETASLSDPNERLTQFTGLHVWLKSIWLVNKKTGDVLVKYEGPFTSCLNYICNF